ncbi:MAG: acyltransferase, partial [Betaproteobacteria bacterium]|nr:acyltransferase [Betaproteobacteria bacterium]
MSTAPEPGARNLEIEALRAVAIVLTLLQHLPTLLPKEGFPGPFLWIYKHFAFWSGVDLFFAISGYVVARALLRGFDDASASGRTRWNEVKRFWVRRAFRLLPAAWLWLAVVLAATVAFNRSGVFGGWDANVRQAWWIFAYAYNWVVQPLFASGVNVAPLGVYWSLALEEQFYLALPLLLLWCDRKAAVALLGLLIAAQFFVLRPAPLVEFWSTLRCEGLAWGVLLAFTAHAGRLERMSACSIGSVGAWALNAAALLAVMVLPWAWFNVSVTTALVAIVCVFWVALAACERGWVMPGCVHARATQWLATRSYALYLSHVPSYMAVKEFA